MRSVRDLAKASQALVRRYPLTADALLAFAFAAAAFVSLAVTYNGLPANQTTFSHGFTLEVVAAMLAVTLPLAWRRRFPFSVGVVVVVVFVVEPHCRSHGRGEHFTAIVLWFMLYSVAVHGRPAVSDRRSLPSFTASSWPSSSANCSSPLRSPPLTAFFALFYNMVELSLPWLLGAAIWSLRDRQRKLADQTVELEIEREENARQAVFAERVRIARELHDVVAHHVSVIGVQAAGARRTMDRQPAQAAEALSSIEDSSRRAVAELHRLLGFLRRDGDTDDLAPQPGLAQLGDLIAEAAPRQT